MAGGAPCRKKAVVYAHGEEITTWRNPGKFRAMRFTYRHVDKVIANSNFTHDELVKLGVPESKIVLISPGVDIERFRPMNDANFLRERIGLKQGQMLILSVGRLNLRKGFDNVIRAIPSLLAQGVDMQYAIIGIGEGHDHLVQLATNLNVADRVHFLGHVAPDELPLWYNACDVFAMPNREINGDTEGFGMVFLEAAACGKPAIAGRAGGTGAAVVDGVTGFSVDGADVAAIEQALHRLLSEETLRAQLGRAGYLRAVGEFSWEAVARKTADIWRHPL